MAVHTKAVGSYTAGVLQLHIHRHSLVHTDSAGVDVSANSVGECKRQGESMPLEAVSPSSIAQEPNDCHTVPDNAANEQP